MRSRGEVQPSWRHVSTTPDGSERPDGEGFGLPSYWIQGIEYPTCPRCSTRMALVFQLDSEDNLDFVFGDSGVAHVTQCPQHPDVVAFAWACC